MSNSIIDLLHPEPEQSYNSCSDIFDEWIGVPFKGTNYFTHVRSPIPLKFLHCMAYLI